MTGFMSDNTLPQITHMHFNFKTPKGLKSLQAMKKKSVKSKKAKTKQKEDKRVEEKMLSFLLFLISSTLEHVEREHLSRARFL